MSIRVEVGRLCCEQRGRRTAEFRILSFVAGGPEPQEGGGLGRARTLGSKVLWHQSSDEAPACVEGQWPRKSDFASFWLNYVLAIVCQRRQNP